MKKTLSFLLLCLLFSSFSVAGTERQREQPEKPNRLEIISKLKSILQYVANTHGKIPLNMPLSEYFPDDDYYIGFLLETLDAYPCLDMSLNELYHSKLPAYTIWSYTGFIYERCVESSQATSLFQKNKRLPASALTDVAIGLPAFFDPKAIEKIILPGHPDRTRLGWYI